MRRAAAIALIVGVALVGCGDDGSRSRAQKHEDKIDAFRAISAAMVARYCSYGSVSRAQLDGCSDHVSAREVIGYSSGPDATNAGRFGAGDLNECLADAGPFCREDDSLEETARWFAKRLSKD